MTTEQVRLALRAVPFRPFTIHMADGRTFEISHPEFLSISKSGRTVIVQEDNDAYSVLDLLLATELHVEPFRQPR